VEDHHVDRLDVEAPRGVKLTSTNSSIGLIVLINPCPQNSGTERMIGTQDQKTSCPGLAPAAWNQNSPACFSPIWW
jgi:hypothetical protein